MLWDVAAALVRSIAFLSRLCSDCSSIAHDVCSAYDSDVAPVLSLLGSAKDALTKVKAAADSAKDLKDKLFLANRDECKEIAERVKMISATVDELRKQYDEAKPAAAAATSKASNSSAAASSVSLRSAAASSAAVAAPPLPADLSAHLSALNASLAAVTTLISAQLLPATEKSWFARHKWILQQARKRDEVRAQFASHAAKISTALSGLGFSLQVQTNGTLLQMAAVTADTALNRSDLLAFQQMHADEIESERASWTAAQREEIAVGFNGLLLQLEESAQKQAAAMKAGFDAAAEFAQVSNRKLDAAGHKMDDANSKLEELKAMMQAMQLQQANALNRDSVSPSEVQRPQWKYSFLQLALADLHIDFDDDDESLLGTGAAGEVWRGTWTPNLISAHGLSSSSSSSAVSPSSPQHGRPMPVAFKLLKFGKLTAEARASVVRQLKREGCLMWLLNGHPCTVQLYAAVTEGKRIGLAFELCNAGTLQSHLYAIAIDEQSGLSSYKRVTAPAALNSTQQLSAVSSLLQAIGFAHAKGVVHRDVKSANVLVHDFNRTGEGVAAASEAASSQSAASSSSSPAASASPPLLSFKLSDFGSARALGQFVGLSAFASSMSGAGQSGGTLRWTPPELLSSSLHTMSAADQRALENSFAVDIYALGLVIGEIFLCAPPFAQLGPQCKDAQLIVAISDPKCSPFDWSAVEVISPKLVALIKACCHRNPHKRSSIAELTYALWPETMQQILMRSQPSPSAQAISAVVDPRPPVTSPVVVSAPSSVPLSDAVRSRIQSALFVLRQSDVDAASVVKACTDLAVLLVDSNGKVIEDACLFVVESDGVQPLVLLLHRLDDGPALLTAASKVLALMSTADAPMVLDSDIPMDARLSAAEKFPLEAALVSNVCYTLLRRNDLTSVPRTVQVLIHALTNHASDPAIVESASGAIADMAIVISFRSSLIAAGCLAALVRAAKRHPAHAGILTAVCRGFVHFAIDDKAVAAEMIKPENGVVLILQSAALEMHETVATEVCRAFQFLLELESSRVVLFEAGVLMDLARATQQHPTNVSIADSVCQAILWLAWTEELSSRMVHDKDSSVVVLLLSILSQHAANASVVAKACEALYQLSLTKSIRPMLIAADVLSPLTRALQQHAADARVCCQVCNAFHLLARDSAGCSAVGSEAGALEAILHVLTMHVDDEDATVSVLNALFYLLDDASNCAQFKRAGGLAQFRVVQAKYSSSWLDEMIAQLEQ